MVSDLSYAQFLCSSSESGDARRKKVYIPLTVFLLLSKTLNVVFPLLCNRNGEVPRVKEKFATK
jgi:hypothetical protein